MHGNPVMPNRTWLEVAVNGPWGRERQPGIPVRIRDIVAEGVACARADCIVYPTIPFGGEHTPASRFAAVEGLARRGLLECAVVDPGSVNIDGFVYLNPNEHIRHGLALAANSRRPRKRVAS